MLGRSPRLIEIAHRERRVLEDERPIAMPRSAQQDGLGARTEEPQIAAGVHTARGATAFAQRVDRAVDGVAFRDPSEIERERHVRDHPGMGFAGRATELEIGEPPAPERQARIEHAVGQRAELQRQAQYPSGGRVNRRPHPERCGIDARHVAPCPRGVHALLDGSEGREGRLDRPRRDGFGLRRGFDRDPGPHPQAHSAQRRRPRGRARWDGWQFAGGHGGEGEPS